MFSGGDGYKTSYSGGFSFECSCQRDATRSVGDLARSGGRTGVMQMNESSSSTAMAKGLFLFGRPPGVYRAQGLASAPEEETDGRN